MKEDDKRKEKRSLKSGQKFGYLTVLSYTDRIGKKGEYKCECDCGNITYARTHSLKFGTHISCGCIMKQKVAERVRLPGYQGLINELFRNYKRSAKDRNYAFEINVDDFKNFILQNCFYCGTHPLKTFDSPSRKRKINDNTDFKYNGVDRLDNNIGYLEQNCVPCCYICNNAKNIMTANEFYIWVNKIYNYQKDLKTFND